MSAVVRLVSRREAAVGSQKQYRLGQVLALTDACGFGLPSANPACPTESSELTGTGSRTFCGRELKPEIPAQLETDVVPHERLNCRQRAPARQQGLELGQTNRTDMDPETVLAVEDAPAKHRACT